MSADSRIRALLIEDNPGDARLVREMLRDAGAGHAVVDLAHAGRLADASSSWRSTSSPG